MAYDEKGNFYFNPELDVADKQALEETDRLEHAMLYKQAQRQEQQTSEITKSAWIDALKEAGLDQEAYNRLFSEDPEGTQELIKESMRHVAKGVASRKGKGPQPKTQTPGRLPQRPAQETDERANERLEKARETVNKRPLSHDEELDVLGAILGDNFRI